MLYLHAHENRLQDRPRESSQNNTHSRTPLNYHYRRCHHEYTPSSSTTSVGCCGVSSHFWPPVFQATLKHTHRNWSSIRSMGESSSQTPREGEMFNWQVHPSIVIIRTDRLSVCTLYWLSPICNAHHQPIEMPSLVLLIPFGGGGNDA